MKIKRFFAKDIRSALDEIKISLGPDAIIMSNKNVEGGVEIVAAIDEDNNAVIAKAPKAQAPIKSAVNSAASAPAGTSRTLNDDQVSLSGFQQRLIKQQAAVVAKEHSQGGVSHGGASQGAVSHGAGHAPGGIESATAPLNPITAAMNPNSESLSMPQWANNIAGSVQQGGVERRVAHGQSPQMPFNSPATSQHSGGLNSGGLNSGGLSPDGEQTLAQLRQEMAAMRQLLQHQVSGLMEQEATRRDPIKAILIKSLTNVGFSPEVCEQLVLDVTPNVTIEQGLNIIANTMSRRVLTTNDDILAHGGIVALLGPTGVGKTTTVAKLAARCAMQYGSDKIAMITTDCYRIGAYEQLNTYGKILGCPVKVAKDAQQLADAIYQCRDKRLVLIDTAGMGQRDIRLSEQLATLVNSSHVNIRSYLVLPATAQRKVLEEAVVQFRKMPLAGCIITKMDEAIGAGDVLSVAITHSLPLAYFTNGQRVPEDIGAVDAKSLINSVVEQLEQTENVSLNQPNSAPFTSFNG